MVTYNDVISKKEEIRKALVENFEILGTNRYVELINDLEQIVWEMRQLETGYVETMEKLLEFEDNFNKILDEISAGNSL